MIRRSTRLALSVIQSQMRRRRSSARMCQVKVKRLVPSPVFWEIGANLTKLEMKIFENSLDLQW